jgi:hypothetical protein
MPRVVVCGAGALGSHLVLLVRNLPCHLTVIDFDRVDAHNVLSQFYGKPNVGKLKVDALKQTMQFLYGIKIETVSNKLVENNVDKLLGGSGLVVDTFDNGTSRRLVQDYVRKHNIPCLHGALAADGAFGRIVWTESFVVDDENVVGAATCEDGDHLPFIAIVAAYTARAIQTFLANNAKHVNYYVTPTSTAQF